MSTSIETPSRKSLHRTIPIRSALQRLEAEGSVVITPHTGATVSEISLDTITEIFMLLEFLENVTFSVIAFDFEQTFKRGISSVSKTPVELTIV